MKKTLFRLLALAALSAGLVGCEVGLHEVVDAAEAGATWVPAIETVWPTPFGQVSVTLVNNEVVDICSVFFFEPGTTDKALAQREWASGDFPPAREATVNVQRGTYDVIVLDCDNKLVAHGTAISVNTLFDTINVGPR